MIVRQHIGCGRLRGPEASGFFPVRFLSVDQSVGISLGGRLAKTESICASRARI